MYFECKFSVLKYENGNETRKAELFLQNAESFTEAEAKMAEFAEMKRDNRELKDIKKSNITEIVAKGLTDGEGRYYKMKTRFIAEKPFAENILVWAKNAKQAIAVTEVYLANNAMEYEFANIAETQILEVFEE